MALFDFLKPRWTSDSMTEDDRDRQMWIVKRSTSLTAWARCRARYAVFAKLVEAQCKEEPVGRMGPKELQKALVSYRQLITDGTFPSFNLAEVAEYEDNKTRWDATVYADVLRGLAFYDSGLARLSQGDRSVFLHNSQGALEDAADAANHQYALYYNGGAKGGDGMVFYGKYVAAMKAALLWASENGGFAAGGLQPMMADLSASVVWQEPREVENGGRKVRLPGTREWLRQQTAHLSNLPAVPFPATEVLVRTGDPCPVFGIYEAQVKDGRMEYMCSGQEAYRYGLPILSPGAGQPITWRLVWEDHRYVDGTVPDEERDFFLEPQTPPDRGHLVGEELVDDWRHDDVIVRRSGQPASHTGTWAALDDAQGRVFWRKGDPLPMRAGIDTDWVYTGV